MKAHYAVREDIRVDLSTQEKWQRVLDLVANVMGIPITVMVRAHEDHLEVFARSAGQDRSYLEGQLFSPREDQYFEAILEDRKMLLVPDARMDRHWAGSLDASMGLVACLGFPILWPSGEVFGVICALDTKARAFTDQEQKFLGMCADNTRDDLAKLIVQSDLQKALAEQIIIGQSLRETEERFEKAFRTSVAGILITTFREGVILDANDTYQKLFGYRYEELIGRPVTEMNIYLSPEDRTKVLQKLLKDGVVRNYEMPLRAKTGEIKYVQVSVQRIETMGREHIITSFYDLTALKNLEREAKLLHERFALAVRAAQAGVWDWDIPNNALWWDDQMYRLYDAAREEFGGAYEAWLTRLHPDDRVWSRAETRMALLGEKEYDTEFRILRADGRIRYIKAYGDVIRDGDGRALRMIGINIDITERKQLEEDLRRSKQLYKETFNQNSVVFLVIDIETGDIYSASPSACHYYGYPEGELIGKNITEINGRNLEDTRRELSSAYRQEKNYFQARHRLPSSEIREVEVFYGPVEIDGKQYVNCIVHDVTESKQVEG